MAETYHSKRFSDLTVYWRKTTENRFSFKLSYLGDVFVDNQVLPCKEETRFPFSYIPTTGQISEYQGCLRYEGKEKEPSCLRFELTSPIRVDEPLIPSSPTPPPPLRPHAELPIEIGLDAGPGDYKKLFPYVYVTPWPKLSDAEKNRHLISLQEQISTSRFFAALIEAKPGGRVAMEQVAVSYIDGSDQFADAPFIDDARKLGDFFERLFLFSDWCTRRVPIDFETLSNKIEFLFGGWATLAEAFENDDFKTGFYALQLTFIALDIIMGYRPDWMVRVYDCIVDTMALMQLTGEIDLKSSDNRPSAATNDNESPRTPGTIPSTAQLTLLLTRTILLPAALFPLPAEPPIDILPAGPKPSLNPFGIGHLHVVRYRHAGYALGGISQIVNVMKGETRALTESEIAQQVLSADATETSRTERRVGAMDKTRTFVDEINKRLSDVAETRSYTDADAQNDLGGWTFTKDPAGGDDKKRYNFGKDIVARSISCFEQSTMARRVVSCAEQHSVTVTRRFNNEAGSRHLVGLYRWVNERMSIRNDAVGNRLIVQIRLPDPAARYLRDALFGEIHRAAPPPTLTEMGVSRYSDISDKLWDATYYLTLLAAYDIADIIQPPRERIITLCVGGTGQLNSRTLPIPSGMLATSASVSLSPGNPAGVEVWLNNEKWDGTDSAVPIAAPLDALQVSLMKETQTPFDQGGETTAAMPFVSVNVSVTCVPTAEAVEAWKYTIYTQLKNGYTVCCAAYRRTLEAQKLRLCHANPDIDKAMVKREMKDACIEVLFRYVHEKRGAFDPSENKRVVAETKERYAHFFQQLFDWGNMSVKLANERPTSLGEEAMAGKDAMMDFIYARNAEILLPLKRDAALVFVYFWATGQIWTGAPSRICGIEPGEDADAEKMNALICRLNAIENTPAGQATDSAWEISVPTTMELIQEDATLAAAEKGADNADHHL